MSTLNEVFGITNEMDYQTQKRTIINRLGYEEVKKCIPFTLEELKTMIEKDPQMNEYQEKWDKAAGYAPAGNFPSIFVGSKLVDLCLQHNASKLSCSKLVGILKECARMWIKEDDTIRLIRKTKELEERQNSLTGKIKDADTVLVDVLNEQDNEFSGFAQDIFNIWKNSSDKGAVEQMFYEFTGLEFKEYLQKSIDTMNHNRNAIQMADVVSVWLKEKSRFRFDMSLLVDEMERIMDAWIPAQMEDSKHEFFGSLIYTVEDFLDKRGIKASDIPCEDRDLAIEYGENPEGLAIIYGEDYDYLADRFAEILNIER